MKKLEELVFILDKSGSMLGKEEDTIGSFNSTIREHTNKNYDVLVTTVLFSDNHTIIHDRIDINKIEQLTRQDYIANGCTALNDAVGDTISHIRDIHKYQRRKEDIPEHTLFFIVTDGLENASCKYSTDDVKNIIDEQKELGWEFIFLGANIDAVKTANKYSIDKSRAITFMCDTKGLKEVSNFTRRASGKLFEMAANERFDNDKLLELREEIDEDYNNRCKRK